MAIRSTDTTVTFKQPFRLSAIDGRQPAGTYRLVVDEEEISGLSFVAFRRTATILHIPAISNPSRSHQALIVDQTELAAALKADVCS